MPPLRNKYNARKVVTDAGKFDSIAEYRYYKTLLDDPDVLSISRQVTYRITVNGHNIGRFVADFVVTYRDNRTEVHEVKNNYLLTTGKGTPAASLYRYKVKLMYAVHGIHVKTISNVTERKRKGSHS